MEEAGLVLIGHGSKLPHNRENIEKIAEMLREHSNFKTVGISFMARDTPTISEAVDAVVKTGVKTIILVPAFLAAGVHTTQDIPEIIGVKAKELSANDVKLIYVEPIGADKRIAEILEERALNALKPQTQSRKIMNSPYGTNAPIAAKKIYEKSMQLIRPEIQEVLKKAPKNHASIIERVVHTTADPEFAKLLVISNKAVEAGVAAIRSGAKVVTDVKMVKAGINEERVKSFGGKILAYIDDERATKMANDETITRSMAAIRLAVNDGLDGAIVLIGNAPTAAYELAKAVQENRAKPALIVATPVGYVDAAESKEVIAKLPVPYIIVKGHKGGSTIAIGIFNALLALAEEPSENQEKN